MNREILFKAKRLSGKKWEIGTVYKSCRSLGKIQWCIMPQAQDGSILSLGIEVFCDTICQFTGLKDKNGNKIFEGDKIYDGTNETTGVVKYKEVYAQFVFEYDNNKKHETLYPAFVRNLEIIGNIHESEV